MGERMEGMKQWIESTVDCRVHFVRFLFSGLAWFAIRWHLSARCVVQANDSWKMLPNEDPGCRQGWWFGIVRLMRGIFRCSLPSTWVLLTFKTKNHDLSLHYAQDCHSCLDYPSIQQPHIHYCCSLVAICDFSSTASFFHSYIWPLGGSSSIYRTISSSKSAPQNAFKPLSILPTVCISW